jgi:hypothetical protein
MSANGSIDVDIAPGHVRNAIKPLSSIGAGVDSENNGAPELIYRPQNVQHLLTAGLGPISYRLYTELSVQDWHWNPQGTWSDPAGRGYFTGDPNGGSIFSSFGYRLPHRGFTHDQGNDDDYGRLTDGDYASYWKSNPYLAEHFTGESDTLHPQWILIDLGSSKPIDAIRIWWANPYAVQYKVQYWTGSDPIYSPGDGSSWKTFPSGGVTAGTGGTVTLQLAPSPQPHRYVRVFMTQSSGTCDSHGAGDMRNCLGYAAFELGLGTVDSNGNFNDLVVHRPDNQQTVTYVSSVDPWHASANRVTNQEQPGLDLVFQSGITRGLPATVPVSMLYGTPDDAAAEVAYLSRRYAIAEIELGEEPDGQFIFPEDYGALYVQWAKRLRSVTPLPLGGPVFQGVNSDVQAWPDARGDVSWLHRFLRYLAEHGQSANLNFMSFEHYPFGPCDVSPNADLLREPELVDRIVKQWHTDGLPAATPMAITELNFSASPTYSFQDIVGGLWWADFAGSFLEDGGKQVYLYQYAPEPLYRNSGYCISWGEYGLYVGRGNYTVRYYGSQYFASQLITQHWVDDRASNALHSVYPAKSSIFDGSGRAIVTAYALGRPDGKYGVMLINKNSTATYRVAVRFHNGQQALHYAGKVDIASIDPQQYQWHADGANSYAAPDGPLVTATVNAGPNTAFTLPPDSLVVLAGNVSR